MAEQQFSLFSSNGERIGEAGAKPYAVAVALAKSHSFSAALEAVDHALAADPGNEKAAILKAAILRKLTASRAPAQRSGAREVIALQVDRNFKEAAALLEELLTEEPENPELHYLSAINHTKLGDHRTAHEKALMVLELEPDHARAVGLRDTLARKFVKPIKPVAVLPDEDSAVSVPAGTEDAEAARKAATMLKVSPVSDADITVAARLADTDHRHLFSLVQAIYLCRAGRLPEAEAAAAAIPRGADLPIDILRRSNKNLREIGRHDLALKVIEARMAENGETPASLIGADLARFSEHAWRQYSAFAEQWPTPDPKGYVLIFDVGHRVCTGMMAPLTRSLRRDGYAVAAITAGTMPTSDDPLLAGIASSIKPDGMTMAEEGLGNDGLRNDWNVDWDNGVVACDGINYFSFFVERLSKLGNAYRSHIDESPQHRKLFETMLRQSDAALTVCRRLLVLALAGKPIRIAAMDTHFAPWGVVRRWCEVEGKHQNINLVALSVGYENYFSNLTTLVASTLCIENLTANPDLRHPLLGGRHRFDRYLAEHPEALDSDAQVLDWIRTNRSRITATDEAARAEVESRARDTHGRGGKVFAAFGKVLVDFAAPDDKGGVFTDFPEWINFLVSTVASTGNLLLIKPHPHEIRHEIASEGVQLLRDLLPTDLPDNVIFLKHSTFNAFELADMVDVGFVWNGTISVEFPVLGRPLVPEGRWAVHDYPVDQETLSDRETYQAVLNGSRDVQLTANTRRRAAAFLRFMKSETVSIPYGYVKRPATNQSIGAVALYEDQMADLEADGDPHVDRAALRFFEL